MSYVAPIVEGHGELDAVPALLRRIAHEIAEASIQVNPPYRVNASAFLKYDLDFRKAIGISAIKAADNDGFVLILLDCDDDCPAQLGPTILAKANAERPDVPFVVCLAYREFETWFLYGARSLAGCCGLPADLQPPESPETIRDAKGWLGQKMPQGYKETSHQVSLVARLDLDAATRSESFRRLVDRLVPLLRR